MKVTKRRGISYILSVAVMTFVTVAMASVVLYWSIGQVSQSQNVFGSAINARINQAMERFAVEDVQFVAHGAGGCTAAVDPSSNGCVQVYVRDVGTTQVVVDAVYVNNQLSTQANYVTSSGSTKLSVGSQQVGYVIVGGPISLTAGTTYSITVGSTRGNTVAVSQTY